MWLVGVGEQHLGAETHCHQAVMFMQIFAGVGEQHARAETHHQTVMSVRMVTPLNEECGLLELVKNTWEL